MSPEGHVRYWRRGQKMLNSKACVHAKCPSIFGRLVGSNYSSNVTASNLQVVIINEVYSQGC